MKGITVTVQGAEELGEVFAATRDEVSSARREGVPIQFEQERGLLEPLIIIVLGEVAKAVVKPFLQRLTRRIEAVMESHRSSGVQDKPFEISIDGVVYRLPEELDRLRAEHTDGAAD